jgi:cysteine synthase A
MIYANAYEVVTDDVFVTLPYLSRHADVYLKLEGLNPAGSIKRKTALGLIEDAERRREVSVGVPVIESSSGSLGIALSSICTAKGYPFTCVVDPNVLSVPRWSPLTPRTPTAGTWRPASPTSASACGGVRRRYG